MPMYRAGFAHPLDEMRDEMDRLWSSLSTVPPLPAWGSRPRMAAYPAVNVNESDACVTVECELPGLDAGDVDIAVSGEEMVLKGSRPEVGGAQPAPGQPAGKASAEAGHAPGHGNGERGPAVTWHRRERGTGSFERRLTLPVPVDASRVEAKLIDGVLTVTCPKAPEHQPHKVTVRVE